MHLFLLLCRVLHVLSFPRLFAGEGAGMTPLSVLRGDWQDTCHDFQALPGHFLCFLGLLFIIYWSLNSLWYYSAVSGINPYCCARVYNKQQPVWATLRCGRSCLDAANRLYLSSDRFPSGLFSWRSSHLDIRHDFYYQCGLSNFHSRLCLSFRHNEVPKQPHRQGLTTHSWIQNMLGSVCNSAVCYRL